jgi:hypothetical protein
MSEKSKKHDHKEKHKKVKITTGPFLIPEEVGPELQGGRENDRLIIILKNPTKKTLYVKVKLGICLEPKHGCKGDFNVFENIEEKEVCLGRFWLKPHSCTRIERNIPRDFAKGKWKKDETNAVYRVTAKGDFEVCGCNVVCGLAEISVTGGSVFIYEEPGLEQADPTLFFPFSNFVLCKKHCEY